VTGGRDEIEQAIETLEDEEPEWVTVGANIGLFD
jgi:hypothetical protein